MDRNLDFGLDLNLFNDVNNITEFDSDDTRIYREDQQVINEIKDYLTVSQRDRDKQITSLLEQFVINYKNKVYDNKQFKNVLFYFSLAFVGVFAIGMIVSLIILSCNSFDDSGIVSFVSACATLIAVPIGILKIIVSYIFPSAEENHIADIVKLIQNNDLENKKINIKALREENTND